MNTPSEQLPQKTPPATKLILFYTINDKSQHIRERLSNLPYLVQQLNYKFTFEMPTVHAKIFREEPKIEKYINWRGKERERTIYPKSQVGDCCHYLQFSKELSPEELTFWQVFKLGYLSNEFNPNGPWRNK